MVELSKFWFDKACSGCACSEVVHPWADNCTDAAGMMLVSCAKGAYKFYAMIYVLQILMRGKKINQSEMIQYFKMYLKSGLFGMTSGWSLTILNCLFRNTLFSRWTYYRAVLLPCTVSGVSVYFEPPYRRVLVTNLFVNLVFEYWVNILVHKQWLKRSTGRETLVFMFGSAVFFYLMRKDRENKKRTPLFWFFTPPQVSKEVGDPVPGFAGRSPACPHSGNCINYVLKGTLHLFAIGSAMTMLRQILSRIMTPAKALASLRFSHLKLGIFFGGYVCFYRLISCLLCRTRGQDSALYALPAAFLAGASFRMSPSLGIALAPITSSLQILISWCYKRGMIPEHWPLVEILYSLSQGFLFHACFMHPELCPNYVRNLTETVTCSRMHEMRQACLKRISEIS